MNKKFSELRAGMSAESQERSAVLAQSMLDAMPVIQKKTGYYIYGSTGCTCCRNENFISGMYEDENYALERLAYHEKSRTVRSQYSSTGLYTLYKTEYELLPDGRIILKNYVFDDDSFYESGHIANDIEGHGESVIGAGKYDGN